MVSLQSRFISRRKNYVQLFHLASTKVLQLCCSLRTNPWSDDFASCLNLDYCFTHGGFYCSSSKDTGPGTWHSVMWTDLNLIFLPTDEADLPSEESRHHLKHWRHVLQGPASFSAESSLFFDDPISFIVDTRNERSIIWIEIAAPRSVLNTALASNLSNCSIQKSCASSERP
jgi:hypothetical protein